MCGGMENGMEKEKIDRINELYRKSKAEGLTDAERKLIHALYFEQMSERQFSQIVGVSQQAINYRKRKILSKLRRVLE